MVSGGQRFRQPRQAYQPFLLSAQGPLRDAPHHPALPGRGQSRQNLRVPDLPLKSPASGEQNSISFPAENNPKASLPSGG